MSLHSQSADRLAHLRLMAAHYPPGHPAVGKGASISLRNCLPVFLADAAVNHILAKFIHKKIDLKRSEGLRSSPESNSVALSDTGFKPVGKCL